MVIWKGLEKIKERGKWCNSTIISIRRKEEKIVEDRDQRELAQNYRFGHQCG